MIRLNCTDSNGALPTVLFLISEIKKIILTFSNLFAGKIRFYTAKILQSKIKVDEILIVQGQLVDVLKGL